MTARIPLGIVLAQALLCATECDFTVQPCQRVRSDSVFFIGQLIRATREVPPPALSGRIKVYEFLVRVKAPLLGLVEGTRELLLVLGNVLPLHRDILFHMERTTDGGLMFPTCGVSGHLDGEHASRSAIDMVDYLRALKQGAPDEGSLTILVKRYMTPDTTQRIEDVKVVLELGNEHREFVTNGQMARVNRLRPGTYRLTASKLGFVEAVEPDTTKEFIVSPRSCFERWVSLVPAAR